MAETSPILTNDAIRRQVLLEGVKEAEWKKFEKFLKEMDKSIRSRLLDEGETINTKRRLSILLQDVTKIQRDIYEEWTGQLTFDMDEIAVMQSDLEVEALNATVDNFEAVKPAATQIITAYQQNPLSLVGKSQGLTLKPFLKQYTTDQIALINGAISQGFAEGQTVNQIVKKIRGTASLNFNDGDLAKVNRNTRAIVRTAIQNAGEQARQRTWDSNKDLIKGVKWVAVLDGNTTTQCRSLDTLGTVYPLDKGPRPPIHYSCRSTVTPVLSETFDFLDKGARRPAIGEDGPTQVNSNTTYYSWLKSQPADFQNDIIGPTRGALLRNGGLTSEEFAALQLNSNFKPRTIDEMKRQAPAAFEQANLD